jgi:hypothetical protein
MAEFVVATVKGEGDEFVTQGPAILVACNKVPCDQLSVMLPWPDDIMLMLTGGTTACTAAL